MSSLVFHIEADKIDTKVIESIKAFFGKQKIQISVKSEKTLAEVVAEAKTSEISYVFEPNEFDEFAQKLLNNETIDYEPFKRINR